MSEAAVNHRRDDLIRIGVWKILWVLVGLTAIPVRLKIDRKVKFPRRGPLLLVANHPCPWDVMMIPWSLHRQVHNLGTDQLLRVKHFGWMFPYFSMVPFKKGMKDPAALAELERRIKRGDAALIFVEGDRTWTGRSNPVKPGIGRMIKRLNVPVGIVRVRTGHMQWPRWAPKPRSVPVIIEHLALKEYPDEATVEEIVEDITKHITVIPQEIELPPRSWGRDLAVGFPEFMWACPHCFHQDGVELVPEDHDSVHCHGCGARWRVTLDCWLRGEGGPAEDMHIDDAYRAVVEHFGALPILDNERHAETGVKLEGEVNLDRIHYGQVEAEHLGLGHLELFEDHLVFTDHRGHDPLKLPFGSIKAVLLQVGDKLQVRTAEDNFQIRPTIHSTNMWKYFIDRHLRHWRELQPDTE